MKKKTITAGIDEVGRGCLAGPVTAAAVILPEGFNNLKINDSKQISYSNRIKLKTEIKNSAISYGVKHQTGKTPIGHMLAYAEEKNPEKKKETCFSFIEATRSEFCTIAKKQISLTKTAVKEKTLEIAKIYPKTKDIVLKKEKNSQTIFFQQKKSPRKLAIVFQNKIFPPSNK